jgi:hypothetical protein
MNLLSLLGFSPTTVILEAVERAHVYRGIAKYIALLVYLALPLWMVLSSDSLTPSTSQLGSDKMASARTRTRRLDGISQFTKADPHGRQTLPDTHGLLAERRVRKWAASRGNIQHRVKNGVYDPISFFHLVDALASIQLNQRFTAGQLADHLNKAKTTFTWDAVTVGRILNDIVESCEEANPGRDHQPLEVFRTWAGREYMLTSFIPARAVLFNLLDDLAILGERTVEQEAKGKYSPKTTSPLAWCPSLAQEITALAG